MIRVGIVHRKHSIISHTRNRKVDSCRPCRAFMARELLDNRDYVLSVPCGVRLRLLVHARTSVSWSCSGCPDHSNTCFVFSCIGDAIAIGLAPHKLRRHATGNNTWLGMPELREVQTPARAGGAQCLAGGKEGREWMGTCQKFLTKCYTMMVQSKNGSPRWKKKRPPRS